MWVKRENEVKFARQRNKMAANLDLFRQPDANTKLDLRSPIVDRDKCFSKRMVKPPVEFV